LLIKASVGESLEVSELKAGKEAAEEALAGMPGEKPDFCFVFCSFKYDPSSLLEAIKEKVGPIPMIGCTTSGEITGKGIKSGSVVLLLLKSPLLRFVTAMGEGVGENPRKAGREAALRSLSLIGADGKLAPQFLIRDEISEFSLITPHHMIVLLDGVKADGANVVNGFVDVLGYNFPIIGGAAGDDLNFEKTYQFCNWKVYTNSVVSVLVSSGLMSGFGVAHGLIPISRGFIVTKSEGNIVYTLDEKPAIEVYKDYIKGEEAQPLTKGKLYMLPPLGIPTIEGEYLLRQPFFLGKDGAIVFAGEVAQDAAVRIMKGEKGDFIDAAKKALKNALLCAGKPDKVAAALIFECKGRHLVLGDEAQTELALIKEMLGENTPIIGLHTYGEVAPLRGTKALFHNFSLVIYVISNIKFRDKILKCILI